MIKIFITVTFAKHLKKLPKDLQDEVREKIAVFQADPWQPSLRTHKLKGRLKGYFSFSVNYKYRVLFEEDSSGTYALLGVGDHDIYK